MSDKIICDCTQVTQGQIEEAIKAGAKTVEAIGDKTGAGTICGVCVDKIEEIIDNTKQFKCILIYAFFN